MTHCIWKQDELQPIFVCVNCGKVSQLELEGEPCENPQPLQKLDQPKPKKKPCNCGRRNAQRKAQERWKVKLQ